MTCNILFSRDLGHGITLQFLLVYFFNLDLHVGNVRFFLFQLVPVLTLFNVRSLYFHVSKVFLRVFSRHFRDYFGPIALSYFHIMMKQMMSGAIGRKAELFSANEASVSFYHHVGRLDMLPHRSRARERFSAMLALKALRGPGLSPRPRQILDPVYLPQMFRPVGGEAKFLLAQVTRVTGNFQMHSLHVFVDGSNAREPFAALETLRMNVSKMLHHLVQGRERQMTFLAFFQYELFAGFIGIVFSFDVEISFGRFVIQRMSMLRE